ncbi:MAG: gliding motility-associated C-terminal domain-containing protein [Flavipsychrobacter sp.]|nr:gliding motility-associated C-terminal domain-containing protein [Flavipsychrobacter sp.]
MRLLFTSIFLTFCFTAGAQNLVPDSSFESYTNCPAFQGQVQCPLTQVFQPTLTDWFSALTTSTDYYNGCTTNQYIDVPNSFWGFIPAHSGVGFVGIIAYGNIGTNNTPGTNYREYIECELTQPLVAGQTYYLSYWVRPMFHPMLQPNCDFMAMDALAASFTIGPLTSPVSPLTSPHILLQSQPPAFLDNPNAWVRIYGQYTATGGEDHLTLGTFNTGSVPPMTMLLPQGGTEFNSYYHIDDVSLRTTPPGSCDTVYAVQDTALCGSGSLQLAPVATATSYAWSTGATTAAISVTATGTYWRVASTGCDATIDTFRVQLYSDTLMTTHDTSLCANVPVLQLSAPAGASSYSWSTGATTATIAISQQGVYYSTAISGCQVLADTFRVVGSQTFSMQHDTLVCFPGLATLSGTDGALSYTWNNGQQTQDIDISAEGIYVCNAYKDCDLYIDSFVVKNKEGFSSIGLGADRLLCREEQHLLGVELPGALSYLWSTGATTCCIAPQQSGSYTLQVDNGCRLLSDTVLVELVRCDDCLFMPTAFTPNGDGKNDRLGVIARCPLSKFNFQVFNRFGEVVFEGKDVMDKWNGQYKGAPAELGVYFFQVRYTTAGNGKEHLLKGDVTLVY